MRFKGDIDSRLTGTHESCFWRTPILAVVVLLLTLGALVAPGDAQETRGNVLGLVTDHSARAVAKATVRITNIATGITSSSETDQTGNYNVPFLPPGTYRVEVQAKGFANAVNPSVALHAGQSLRLDFSLQIGSVRQQITVSARTPMLQTSSTITGQTISQESIESLPIASRDLTSVALLGPGMQATNNGIAGTLSGLLTNGNTITADGLRDSANQYTIDAANINVGLYNYPGFVPIPESVQEFSVFTGNYSARYGQYAGAHVNFVLKSGTNSFHGSAFDYLQNEALNARNYFAPSVPVLRQNQYGAVFSGPIKRNNTFFMLSYQGLRHSTNSFVQNIVITPAQRQGDLSKLPNGSAAPPFIDPTMGLPFPNNQIPESRISSQAKAAFTLDPLPNQIGNLNYGNFVATPINGDGGLVKVDHSFGYRDQLSGRFLMNNSSRVTTSGSAPPLNTSRFPITAKNIALVEVHTFSPTAVLSTQISWNRENLDQLYPGTPSDLDSRKLFDMTIPSDVGPGSPLVAYPYFTISGYTSIGSLGNTPLFQKDQNYQIASQLAISRGRHNMEFGFEVDRYRSSRLVNDNTNGQLNFSPTNQAGTGSALADFLLGLPASSTVSTAGISVDLRRSVVDLFATDKWQITSKFTADVGVRYELDTPANEHNGRISLFNYTPPGSFHQLSPGDALWHGDLNNFAPRIGLNYSLTGHDVIRAASGIYYSNSPQLNLTFAASNPPFITTYSFNASSSSPLASANPFPLDQAATGAFPSPFAIQSYQHTPAVYAWMLDLQHSFSPTLLLDIGYQGNRGLHFGRTMTLNVPLTPGPGAIQPRRPLPTIGPVRSYSFDSFSTFNSLQAKLEKRFSNGLQFLISYTWEKSLDLASNELNGGTVIPTDLDFDYGPSNFDIPQNLTVSYVYELPFGRGQSFLDDPGIAQELLGGWRLSGVTTLRSGFSFTPTYPGDVANVGLGTRPMRVCSGNLDHKTIDRWFDTSCFKAPAKYTFGDSRRGILFGPGYKDWDMSLMKSFPTYKEQHLTVRASFFNVFNNVNFGGPASVISEPTAGEIRSAHAARTGQVGLKYTF